MATKEGFIMLAIFALVVMAYSNSGEPLSKCTRKCMPVCLKVDGATMDTCELVCTSYCNHVAESSMEKRRAVWDWTNSLRH
ncbi:hypothetical protein SLEP1_g42557 [Rubroshorea leprosula]|uniref:Uncharacterized protein n=1 Tax=Rubroshorea leprosula TaxID=152421 RepID=A0AAV5LA60_9ROSI|nr:hypothetical protein SLEP1_g42557 [Rubroshorea leprosula]